MTNEQILSQIEKLEKGLSNSQVPESAKPQLRAKIEALKSQLKQAEEKSEEKIEKIEKEEKKIESELEETIKKLKSGLENKQIPDSVKETMRKKIADAEEKLEKSKKEAAQDKKEAKEEIKEVKEAVQKVVEKVEEKVEGKGEKDSGKKKPAEKNKPVPKPKIQEKKREKKSSERKKKLNEIMSDLDKLISKHKGLAKYKGADVDLDKDSKRKAKPFGYRFVGKNDYRVPTKEQIKRGLKRGTIDYEARPNRADKYPKGYKGKIMLKKGGSVSNEDKQRFAKPQGWRWKDSAVEDGIITRAGLSKSPSARMIKAYPDYVYQEARPTKSDKNPSRKYQSFGKGGKVKPSDEDKQRFAKPKGWRWKDEAVTDGIIKKAALSKSPSLHMRKKYPDYVYKEERPTKSDKKPSRKYISV